MEGLSLEDVEGKARRDLPREKFCFDIGETDISNGAYCLDMIGNCSFSRRERLIGRLTFEIIKKKSHPVKGEWLIINIHPNNLDFNRIGISISAKAVLKSTKRNRLKRFIRETYRLHKNELKKGFDIIVRSKPMEECPKFRVVEKDLLDIFKKGKILAS